MGLDVISDQPTPLAATQQEPATVPDPPERSYSKPRLPHYLQYGALRAVVAALGTLGVRPAAAVGARIARLGYRPLGIRRTVVEQQIAASFPEFDNQRVAEIARGAYDHLGRTSMEAALLPSLSRQQILGLFEGTDGLDSFEEVRSQGRGVLLVSGHLGNWELAGAYIAASGVPFHAIARGQENPLFDRWLTKTRGDVGMRIVHDSQAVRQVPRAIRANHVVGMLVDQGGLGLASSWVPFFGRLAKTPRGPAVFALRLGAPVVFTCAIRQPSGRYRMIFQPVAVTSTGDRDADIDAIVRAYTATLEQWVRRAPEQYFWHHRRWKHQPPESHNQPETQ
jgi:Kdo2-lipid IVA lauroyltransferase/acyltransferase